MSTTPYECECDCDCVIDMEAMGIGVAEVLQYARGVFDSDEVHALIQGLQAILDHRASKGVGYRQR